jgi:hypothetical protein
MRMTKVERVIDFLTACIIWLMILIVVSTVVTLVGIGCAIMFIPTFVMSKLRRS